MLADVEVNSTVYVQPTACRFMYFAGRAAPDEERFHGSAKHHAVADRRTAGTRGRANGFVFRRIWGGKTCKAEIYERGDHFSRPIVASIQVQHSANFLLKLPHSHRLAREAREEIAQRTRRGAKAELAQQVIELFEHLPLPSACIARERRESRALMKRQAP
jgi:hypothetical protein